MNSVPQTITDEMWETLDSVSDETGEQELSNRYILKYEGWSPSCFPAAVTSEGAMRSYAVGHSDAVLQEWRQAMRKRGYRATSEEAHDSNLGLYGVTYALYEKVGKK